MSHEPEEIKTAHSKGEEPQLQEMKGRVASREEIIAACIAQREGMRSAMNMEGELDPYYFWD